jgi:hypothetical protein
MGQANMGQANMEPNSIFCPSATKVESDDFRYLKLAMMPALEAPHPAGSSGKENQQQQ